MPRANRLGMLGAAAFVAAGCGNSAGVVGSTAAPTRDERCLNVPAPVVEAIALKLKGGDGLTSAQAVKSFDYEMPTYFVSATLTSGAVGTWAVVGKLAPGGTVYAVDDVAKDSSAWPAGDESDIYISMIDDGADPSRSCAEAD